MVQEDIERMEAALTALKVAGGDLVDDEADELQAKIDKAKLDIAAAAQQATADVVEAKHEADSWWVSHRNDIYQAVEIVALVYIIYMTGMGMSIGAIMTNALASLKPEFSAQGNAFLNTIQQFAGAIGTSLTSAIVALSQA